MPMFRWHEHVVLHHFQPNASLPVYDVLMEGRGLRPCSLQLHLGRTISNISNSFKTLVWTTLGYSSQNSGIYFRACRA